MKQDDPSQSTKKKDEQGSNLALPDRVEPPPPKAEVTPPQPPVPPTVLPENLSGNSANEKDKTNKQSCKEVSVSIKKDPELSRFESYSLALSGITLGVLILTFVVFFAQLEESKTQTGIFQGQAKQAAKDAATQIGIARQALIDSNESFRIGNAPYVWIAGLPTYEIHKNPDGTSQVVVDAHFTNFGKSPAIDLQGSRDLEIGIGAMGKIHSKPLGTGKALLPPTKEDFFSAVTPPFKTLPDLSKDDTIVVFARMQYRDMVGHRYETNLCMARLQTGAWEYCKNHNEIKDCAKETCEK